MSAAGAVLDPRARGESPFMRGLRALLRKRVARIALLVILVFYGAGIYTMLGWVGVDTGLQDPNATNLQERRSIREVDGRAETLGAFASRLDLDLDVLRALNPDVAAEAGEWTPDTRLEIGASLTLAEGEGLQGPSSRHWFGTDRLGRDLFSRALHSLRTTVIVTLIVVLLGNILLGLGLGLLAGYRGGRIDAVIMRLAETVMALPDLLILLVLVAAFRDRWDEWFMAIEDWLGFPYLIQQGVADYTLITFGMSFVSWGGAARFYRGIALQIREREFILASEVVGARTVRLLTRHFFPSVLPWFVVGTSASLGAVAGSEVVLTWLGIGVRPPTSSFGAMVSDAGGVLTLTLHPQLLLVPTLFVLALMLSFSLLGDALNDVVNPRGR